MCEKAKLETAVTGGGLRLTTLRLDWQGVASSEALGNNK
jgi:hypothetical protein